MENVNSSNSQTPWYILASEKEKPDKWNLGLTNQEFFDNEERKKDPYEDGIDYWWK